MEEAGLDKAACPIKDAGLRVSSLCRGGFLTAADAEGQAAALADNRAAILEAAALDTRDLFLVVGGLAPGEKDVVAARWRVADRLADLVPFAVDTFHVWWDPDPKAQIGRAGRENRIASHQVCDFNMPIAADPLLSRGYMGDGVIDFATITTWFARPATPVISRLQFSTRTSGTRRAAPSLKRSRRATPSSCCRTSRPGPSASPRKEHPGPRTGVFFVMPGRIRQGCLRPSHFGAPGGNRTPDRRIRRPLLYPLSYWGTWRHDQKSGA